MSSVWTYSELVKDPVPLYGIPAGVGRITQLGFTGTSGEVNSWQQLALLRLLEGFAAQVDVQVSLHEGDCVGADALAARLARSVGMWVVGHPPDDPKLRAFFPADESWPEKPYMDRNTDIAQAGQALIAVPPTDEEVVRSGTWATVRRGRKARIPVIGLGPHQVWLELPKSEPDAVTL